MKKLSLVIPVYNEIAVIGDAYQRVTSLMTEQLSGYQYEILFIDNFSTDGTRDQLRILAQKDPQHVRVILNGSNFGWMRSSFYGILQSSGDATVLLSADMQEPPEVIPQFVQAWEEGSKVIIGIKTKSQESRWKYALRQLYYKTIERISDTEHIRQFMGFGLYDRSFVDVLRKLDDPMPYFRGIVAELGFSMKRISYEQQARKKGKTHFNFYGMYDLAMLGITSYSKVLMRMSTMIGFAVSLLSLLIGVTTLILKLFHIVEYPLGTGAMIIGIFLLGGLNLFFVGLLGEYLLNINTRIMKRPLVVEESRINFPAQGDQP